MGDKDVPFTAEWAENIRYRTDPNRVEQAQVTRYVPSENQPLAKGAPPGLSTKTRSTSSDPSAQAPTPALSRSTGRGGEGSYYDISMLKAPVWKWEIAWYFFLGGLSAGAYVISRMAFRHGKEECPDVCRTGARVALLAFLPCPPLLIHDLGDPKRFHHMMRVWKPTTPMNLGTWSILGYSGMVTFEVLRKYLEEHEREHGPGLRRHLFRLMDHPLPLLVHDALGVPFALLVAGYTGVLLSCTSNPLWSKNLWLGPLFSASAIGTGAAATSLAIDLTGGAEDSHSQRVLEKIDTAAHIAEVACMAGFLKQAGEKAQPLTKGKHRKHMMVAAGCLAGAEVIRHLPLQGRAKKLARMTSSLLTLGSGFALRWAMVQAGHDAANDPRLARIASRPQTQSAQRRQVQSTNKARPNG